jgi:glutaconate CoA-transferase subunit B
VTAAEPGYSADEMMTVAAARELRGTRVCFVGIGLPSLAANLARQLHQPDLVLIYESGTIGAKPSRPPLSVGDGELAETADLVVSMPEIFAYWLQGGRIEVGFLGGAQIDRFGNLNTTVIGPYERPQIRLPGAGGAPEIAWCAQRVVVIMRHRRRAFVERLEFLTTPGLCPGDPERGGAPGKGPTAVITDLGVLRPDPATQELVLAELHPGVDLDRVRAETGWRLREATSVGRTTPPTPEEIDVLRRLSS